MRLTTRFVVIGTSALLVTSMGLANSATVKLGAKCTKAGAAATANGQSLVCTVKGRTRTWQVAAAPVTTVAPVTTAAAGGGATTSATTVAPKAAGLAIVPGFDGKTISIGILGNVAAAKP